MSLGFAAKASVIASEGSGHLVALLGGSFQVEVGLTLSPRP